MGTNGLRLRRSLPKHCFFFSPPFLPVFAYFLPNPTFLPPAPRQQSPGDASYEMGAHELMHWGRERLL